MRELQYIALAMAFAACIYLVARVIGWTLKALDDDSHMCTHPHNDDDPCAVCDRENGI